jgi:hypothetical protein
MRKPLNVSESRLSDLLTSTGFRSATRWHGEYAWSRWNSSLGVSEWVLVGFAGKKKEAVSANVGVGITRVLAFRIKHELLIDVADSKETLDEFGFWIPDRGRAIVDSVEKAKGWEHRLAVIAPVAVQSFALKHGSEMLLKTANSRQRSSELLRQLDSKKSLYLQIQELEARHGHTFRKEAERLAERPGVMQVVDAKEHYLLACCAVLTGAQGRAFIGQDPLIDDDLMWQIQLVADGLLLWAREVGAK